MKWLFYGKKERGKQMFDWNLNQKKCFINWPFQEFKIAAPEWEQTEFEQKPYTYITKYFHEGFI